MNASCITTAVMAMLLGFWPAFGEIVIQSTPPRTNEPAIVVPPPGSGEAARTDVLEFLNGDVLHGQFLAVDGARGVRWQHQAVKQPLEISLNGLARIKLERPKSTNAAARPNCSVRLVNKDELLGTLVSMDAEKLQLETWYGGTLNIPRKALEFIAPSQGKTSVIYEGPTSIEGWNMPRNNQPVRRPQNTGPWKYSNGGFVSGGAGPIGRDFPFPPLVNVELDIAWRGFLQTAVSVLSDTLETYGGNAYLLQLNQGSVYLQRISRTGDSSGFGSIEVPTLVRKNQAHISIRINKEQKMISLLVDGTMVRQFNDKGDLPAGSNLVFHQQGQGFTRISNIKVSAWDGKFETPGGAAKSKEDLVRMLNNDKLSGTLKGIQNGTIQFQTAFATLDVPMDKVAEIELGTGGTEAPPPSPTDARLVFAGRGSVTFQIDRWDDQQITGSSPNLGKVKFNPMTFTSAQFNLDKKRTEADSFDGAGPDGLIIDFE